LPSARHRGTSGDRPAPRPVLFHGHGIDAHDFSALTPGELPRVNEQGARRGIDLVPTIFLRRSWLGQLLALLEAYAGAADAFPHILGFSIEGPLLGPEGGTPRAASWLPTLSEWRRIAALGSNGLRYLVLAPDAMELDDPLGPGYRFADLVEELYAHDVRIALGHFRHDHPQRSAERAERLIDFVHELAGEAPSNVLTDHLFNDMPRAFRHVWRGEPAATRDAEVAEFLACPWESEELAELLGPVPATLLEAARRERLLPCLNFDGAHVDLDICRRTVSYVGAGGIIAITDHVEGAHMAGEPLHRQPDSSLWLRDDEVVAAGSCELDAHIANMRAIGMQEEEIFLVTCENPRRALATRVR
jgi:N-acetylglucosamine-6-phosphate deacetylase